MIDVFFGVEYGGQSGWTSLERGMMSINPAINFLEKVEEHKGIFHQNSSNSLSHLNYLYTYYTTF